MSNQKMKVKSKVTMAEAVSHLENLVSSLKEGTVCIRKNEESVTLTPQDVVSFELEAEVKLDKDNLKEKLAIELKWKKGEKAVSEGDAFTITHLEPANDE